jgi:hypothetical protein
MAEYKGIKGFKVQYLSADPSNPIIGQTWYNDTSKDLTSWALGGSLATGRSNAEGAGTQTASLLTGGNRPPPAGNLTEEYNGTSWTAGGTLNTARTALGAAGTQTAGLAFGGYTGTTESGATEEYDGTSWASNPTGLNTARNELTGTGSQTAALGFGGSTGSVTGATEEWTGAGAAVTKTITVS